MINIKVYETRLKSRMVELNQRLHGIEAELESHQSKDWEELAVEREEDEVLENMGHSGLVELEQIKAAITRINQGEYGFCVKCGAQISEDRLHVLPATPFCRTCAA